MPEILIEFANRLPPLPDNPVMIPPECPAPPKNYKELLRRQTLVFEEMQSALKIADSPDQVFTDDQILILNKIRKAIN